MTIQEALQALSLAYPQGGWCLRDGVIHGRIGPQGARSSLEVVADGERWTCTNSGCHLGVSCTDAHPVNALYGAIKETLALLEVLP